MSAAESRDCNPCEGGGQAARLHLTTPHSSQAVTAVLLLFTGGDNHTEAGLCLSCHTYNCPAAAGSAYCYSFLFQMDEILASTADHIKNFAVVFLVDISAVPDFNTMYELYDPCTIMFFFR